MTNIVMAEVLKKLHLDDLTDKFDYQKVTPDIVTRLSVIEMKNLGVLRKEDMINLRNECIKFGSRQVNLGESVCGPPQFDIPEQFLENLLEEGFSVDGISKLLSVSERTIYRRMQKYNIYKHNFSTCTDDELDRHISNIIKEFPFCGENLLGQLLKRRGLHVQRYRLRDSIHRLDASRIKERKKGCLHRRVYDVQGPNHLWHVDTNHKLIRWGFITAGGIDEFSRMVTYLKCVDNNKADTLLTAFLEGVEKYGTPQRVRSDMGMENVAIADFMINERGVGHGSMITGKSVHNQRIERLWRDVYTGVLCFYYNLFYHMEDEGLLDPLNDIHIAALHWTFLAKINSKLDLWREAWAYHRIRTVKATPNHLWIAGQMQNPVGLEQVDLNMYGVEGLISADSHEVSTDNRPIIDSLSTRVIDDNCFRELHDNFPSSWSCSNFGIDVYQQVIEVIVRHNRV